MLLLLHCFATEVHAPVRTSQRALSVATIHPRGGSLTGVGDLNSRFPVRAS
jgi:hypothetical protein